MQGRTFALILDAPPHSPLYPGDLKGSVMKHLTLPLLLLALMAGCSTTPDGVATVEDRSVKAEAKKADGAASAQAKGADGKPTELAAAGTTGTAGGAGQAGTTPGVAAKPQDAVQTQGVAVPITEVKPLDAATTARPSLVAPPHPLRDPKNPLSQRRMQYDYDSAAIRTEYQDLLEAHAQYLKTAKNANLILQGHADERGSREYNLALGQRRAEGVLKALQLLGVQDSQVEAVSLGEEKPLAEGQSEEAWKQNRRVELLYQGE